MTAGADRVLKSNPLALPSANVLREESAKGYTHGPRIDSNTVILVVTIRTGDDNIRRAPNVEAVGVLALAVASRVVDGHAGDGEPVRTVDADGLDGRVLDVQVGDGRGG